MPWTPWLSRAQEYILHALSQPRPHTALEAEVAEQHAARAAPGAPQRAANMKRVRSVSRAMCASRAVIGSCCGKPAHLLCLQFKIANLPSSAWTSVVTAVHAHRTFLHAGGTDVIAAAQALPLSMLPCMKLCVVMLSCHRGF